MEARSGFWIYVFAALVVFTVAFLAIEKPRLDFGLPLHSDEYDNIALAQKSVQLGKIYVSDPFASESGKSAYVADEKGYDPEAGYNSLLTSISLFSGIPRIEMHFIIPIFVLMVIFLLTFVMLRSITGNGFVSFVASMFIFLLPSTQQMLGPAFMVASNVGLAFILALVYFGIKALKERKDILLFAMLFIACIAIYPPATVVAAISLLLFVSLNRQLLEKNLGFIVGASATMALLFIAFFSLFLIGSGLNPVQLLLEYGFEFVGNAIDFAFDQFLFRENYSKDMPFLLEYLGIAGLPTAILFVAGLGYFFWKELSKKINFETKFLFATALALSLLAYAGINSGRGILVPTERLVYFAGYFVLLCAGIFFSEIAIKFCEMQESRKIFEEGAKKYFYSFVVLLLAASVLAVQPFTIESLQPNITGAEMDGVDWIKENTPEKSFVLAPPYVSKPIKVFTGREVACTSSTRFGCPEELNLLASSFFFAACDGKSKILNEYFRADYVLVQKRLDVGEKTIEFPEQNCNFMEKSFEGENISIYKINRSLIPGGNAIDP